MLCHLSFKQEHLWEWQGFLIVPMTCQSQVLDVINSPWYGFYLMEWGLNSNTKVIGYSYNICASVALCILHAGHYCGSQGL